MLSKSVAGRANLDKSDSQCDTLPSHFPKTTSRQYVRHMSGRSNTHLVLADDGCYYALKLRPSGNKIRWLINEVICTSLLNMLHLPAASISMQHVPKSVLNSTIDLKAGHLGANHGFHFASRYPVDPSRSAVYDYMPSKAIDWVANIDDFLGILCFDKWVGNLHRQVVFYRDTMNPVASTVRHAGYLACMIDHSAAFCGRNWTFHDQPELGVYPQHAVYRNVNGLDSFQEWIKAISLLPDKALVDAYQSVPADWRMGEERRLDDLLTRLGTRRNKIPELLCRTKSEHPALFPHWQ